MQSKLSKLQKAILLYIYKNRKKQEGFINDRKTEIKKNAVSNPWYRGTMVKSIAKEMNKLIIGKSGMQRVPDSYYTVYNKSIRALGGRGLIEYNHYVLVRIANVAGDDYYNDWRQFIWLTHEGEEIVKQLEKPY